MIRPGASLTDTVLGSVLMVAVYGLAASSVATTVKAANRAIEEAALLAELGRLDAVLIEGSGRIVQPVHLPAMDAVMETASVAIGYLDGDATRALVIAWDDEAISVGGLDELHRFVRLHLRSVEIVPDPIPVLRVTVAHRDRAWVIAAPFGGVPARGVSLRGAVRHP